MKIFKIFFLLLFFGYNCKLEAQFVTIPDPNFVTFLQQHYPSCMSGNQMDITCPQIVNAPQLFVNSQSISNLSGVEYFVNLTSLACDYNQLTSLPQLTNTLVSLTCSHNQLTNLPDLPNSLESLICHDNQLTILPNLPSNLTQLYCGYNFLTELPPLPTSLWTLSCFHNSLTSLPSLSQLGILNCQFNNLTSLPVLPNSLIALNCQFNQLEELPFLPNTLMVLNCGNNQIASLPDLPNELETFICDSNSISCFPIFPNSLLDTINFSISGNPFLCLPNYIPAMDATTLNYPLCQENDITNNPNGCNSSKGILGTVYNDLDNDCNFNSSDVGVHNFTVKLYDVGGTLIKQNFTANNGIYQFLENSGTYSVKIDTTNLPYFIMCNNPGLDSLVNIPIDTLIKNVDFSMTCKPGFDIGNKSILTNGWVFPGQNHEVKITAGDMSQFYNFSCASGVSGQVQISISGPVTYQSNAAGTLTPLVNGNTYTYDIADFGTTNIFESFGLIFQTDTTAQASDQICVSVSVTPELGDNNPSNNLYEFCYNVVNSYDPNMKEVYPVNVAPGFEDYFTYTIHFQNTGTAPAMNIRLVDTLDANLDLETFQILNYSHYQTANVRNNVLTFHFPNIQLPDSTSNPEGSKGYVQYRIKPKANLALGTQIKNTANIYFDYNDPIVTNTTVNEYVTTNSLHENEQVSVKVYPNPFSSSTTVAFGQAMTNADIHLYNVYGQEVRKISNFSGTKLSIQKESLTAGIYFLQIKNEQHSQKIKLIISE